MRGHGVALVLVLAGCDARHATPPAAHDAAPVDATSSDATPETGTVTDAEAGAPEAAPLPCLGLDAGAVPSDDCVFVGRCAADCLTGAASAYACSAQDGGPGRYPSAFGAPGGSVTVVAEDATAYPWDGAAFLSCGPLSCVRWSMADHRDGGSAWSGDPCAAGDGSIEAWACPAVAGVTPGAADCFNAGDPQAIGGGSTGIASNAVWCCAPAIDAGVADAPSGS